MDPSEILKKNLSLLTQQLQPDEVLDHLFSVDVLSEVEYDRCRDNKVKSDGIRDLVKLLMCKGERGYKQFCIVLDRDQRHVKQALDDTARGKGSHELVYIPETKLAKELEAKEETIRSFEKQLQRMKQEYENAVTNERAKIDRELKEESRRKINAQRDLEAQMTRNHSLGEHIIKLEKEIQDLQSKSLALPRIEFEQEEQKQPRVSGPIDRMKCALVTSEACDPKQGLVLPCLHYVCQPCLQQHAEKNLICFCGREVARNDVTRVDYVRRHEQTRETNICCGFRKEPCHGAVVSTCRVCKIYLCQNCNLLHKDIKSSASHNVQDITRSPENENGEHLKKPMCDNHSTQRVMYIDHQCHKNICGTCFSNLHARHKVSPIEEEYEKQKRLLREVIEAHNRSLQNLQGCLNQRHDRFNALKSNPKAKLQHMSNFYENIVQALKDRFNELRQSMILECKKLQDDIVQDMKSLQETEAAFKMTLDYAQRCFKVDQMQLIDLAPMIAKNAEEDRKRLLPKCTAMNKDIVFSPQGHAALHSLIRRVGDIKCVQGIHTSHHDDLPTLEELQKQNDALKKELASVKAEYKMKEAKNQEEKDLSCEAASLLKEKLKQWGIFIHEPRQLRKSYILQCIQLKFSNDKLNFHHARITPKGELQNGGQTFRFQPQGRLQRYMGTCGTSTLPSPAVPGYLEMFAKVSLKDTLTKNNLILEIGMCREEFKDTEHTLGNMPHSYSMAVTHCLKHNRICRTFFKEKRHLLCLPTEALPNKMVSSTLHVGIAYDDTRQKVAFIDVETSKVMTVVDDVDFRMPLLPMFGVYNPDRVSVSMISVKVGEMDMPDEKIGLILNALS